MEPELAKEASFRAAEILSGMGYTGKYGSTHLFDLGLQANSITAILHNMIGYQVAKIDPSWEFKPKGGKTPDLVRGNGGVQIKVSSDARIKGNYVSPGKGYYLAVKYVREDYTIKIREILMGELGEADWDRRQGTQFAFLKKEAEARLQRVYP